MPSKKQYDLVLDDGPDSKVPLHNEDAFQHGIHFLAKYIGTLDVPRPTSRVEIVAAMRRIRYEFKAKAVKKKKVSLTVSVEGVKVALQKKSRRKQQQWIWDESCLTLLQHPIYRIFYVSHDSQDLKIFSYIARDSSTNVFRCNVFKAYKKSQAMNIVRTIGQAFEVCHRISLQASAQNEEGNDAGSEKSSEEGTGTQPTTALQSTSTLEKPVMASSPSENGTSTSTPSPEEVVKPSQHLLDSFCDKPFISSDTLASPMIPAGGDENNGSAGTFHGNQLLRHHLDLQIQQTQFLVSQVQLVKDQLAAETAARTKAQTQVHELLTQNRELLLYISTLVTRLVQLEPSVQDVTSPNLQHSPCEILDTSVSSVIEPSSILMSISSNLSNLNDSASFQNMNCHPAGKITSSLPGNENTDEAAEPPSSSSEKTKPGIFDSRQENTSCETTIITASNPNKSKISSVNLSNGVVDRNLFGDDKIPLQNGESKKEGSKVATPARLTDNFRNRLNLNAAPRLDPPPRINRNSSRVPFHANSSGVCNSSTTNSALTDDNAVRKDTNGLKKPFNWENFVLSEKTNNGSVQNDLNLSLPIIRHEIVDNKSPTRLLEQISCDNGNGNANDLVESSRGPGLAIQGLKGIMNRFAVQHQNSIDSTSKLKLSFSDNE